jgi:hypothetical protein
MVLFSEGTRDGTAEGRITQVEGIRIGWEQRELRFLSRQKRSFAHEPSVVVVVVVEVIKGREQRSLRAKCRVCMYWWQVGGLVPVDGGMTRQLQSHRRVGSRRRGRGKVGRLRGQMGTHSNL